MGNIFFRLLILAMSMIMYLQRFGSGTGELALLLTGMVFSYTDIIFEGFTRFTSHRAGAAAETAVLILFCFAACFYPQLSVFIPLTGICAVVMWLRLPVIFQTIALVYNLIVSLSPESAMSLLMLFVAVTGAQFFERNEIFIDNLKKQRDYSREYEMLLEEKNNALTKQQDHMVYTATLKERNRIAREIHDNVGHMLTRSILQLGAIKVINKDETLNAPLDDLAETLNLAMTNIRTSVHDLHDESVNLESAVREMTNAVEDFGVHLEYDMGDNIPRDIKYAFIAIIKECISNSIKHSNGDKIKISIVEQPGFYQLSCSDNGNNADIDYSSGIGLSNINDRVKQMKGNLRITTDSGFAVMVTVMKGERL